MSDKHPVDRAHQIDERTGRIRGAKRTVPESIDNVFYGQLCRAGNTGVICAKGVELMRVRGSDKRLAETFGDFDGAAIGIEKPTPEMAQLDRVKTIDLLDELLADRAPQDVERMRRDREERRAAARAQRHEIIQRPKR